VRASDSPAIGRWWHSPLGEEGAASAEADLLVTLISLSAETLPADDCRRLRRHRYRGALSKPLLGQIVLQVLKRQRAPLWFEAAVGNRLCLADFIETTDRALGGGACFCLASAFQRYLTDAPPPLEPVRQPSLIIWGEADKSHRRTDKTSSRVYCSEAKEFSFAQAGHFPELEQPELFAQTLKQWIYPPA
jgi:pimeloyl-ACP methyl ester carboxylesterase